MIHSKLKTPILIVVLSFFLFGFNSKVKLLSPDDILLRSRYALLNVKSVNYSCNFMQKFAGGKDTLKTMANILLEKKSEDTLLHCNLKLTSQFTFYALTFKTELFYNGKKNVALNHSRKKVTIDTIGNRGKGKPTMDMLKQNFPTANLINHYTEQLPFEPFFKKGAIINTLEETQIGSYTCFKLEITTKDFPENTKRITTLFIDKQSYLPIKRIDIVGLDNKQQYSDFTLSEIKINNPSIVAQIKPPFIPKDYSVDYYRLDRY
ncbi:hypothetical protein [Aurantibacillus circumpalustris]|uniref:hypothetical protein n=1 Tax=Aurantibacillus circumpalustris TaxID=3036359 RepID=UPI00295AC194|nr:hypothetical protein [Aurantibacillus circumpalustris]